MSMNRIVWKLPRSRALGALVATAALVGLAGCTAAPAAPTPAASATPQRFTCPSADEVGALTAIALERTIEHGDCTYTSTGDGPRISIGMQHPARSAEAPVASLAVARQAALDRDAITVTDAREFSFDAFTTQSIDGTCTAWVIAGDGVVTAVTARQDGVTAARSCALTRSAVLLLGTATTRLGAAAAPTMSVVAAQRSARVKGSTDLWTTRLAQSVRVRVDRIPAAGTGYLPASASGPDTFVGAAARVDPSSAVVVVVSGAADVGADRLQVERAASQAYSAAAARAPRAHLIVVGPTSALPPSVDVLALRDDLRAAARLAGAAFVDPIADRWSTAGGSGTVAAFAARLTPTVRAAIG